MLTRMLKLTLCTLVAFANSYPVRADNFDNEWESIASSEATPPPSSTGRRVASNADEPETTNATRQFHEVLDQLLAEFSFDVKKGQLNSLKNVSIRRVEVSDALPRTYRTYVEMLVSERIRENSRVRLVTCVPCRTKTSHLVEGKLMITSPTTNMASMREAANQLGIDQFMDVVLIYHTTHMVLALEIFDVNTQESLWSRTYNSETMRSRYQKLAVDYEQIERTRVSDEYIPEYRILLGVGGGIVSNINGRSADNGVVSLMARASEKFDNRGHEFGLQSNLYLRKSNLLNQVDEVREVPEGTKKKAEDLTPWNYALGLYAMYTRNFLGSLESYNQIRHSANIGLGFVYAAPMFLTTSMRFGWDIHFGKKFTTNIGVLYLMPATVNEDSQNVKTKGGTGGEITVSINL